jgi:hypothetical protein
MNERIKEFAHKCGFIAYTGDDGTDDESLTKFADLIRADEREACAKVCEEIMEEHNPFDRQANIARRCTSAIRARGNA